MSATDADPAAAPTPPADPPRRRGGDALLIAVIASVGFMTIGVQASAIPLMPRMPEYLGASPADTPWILTSTLLVSSAAAPIAGRLGDMYGKRPVLLGVLVIVAAGGALVALSDQLVPVIVGRSLQGLGLGAVPLGMSIMRDRLSPKNLVRGIATVSAMMGIGGALSHPIVALVAEQLHWHWVFAGAAGLAVIALIAVLIVVPPGGPRSGGRFDVPGALLYAVGLVAFMLPVSKLPEWGFSLPTIGLLALSVAALAVWVVVELRTARPVVDLRIAFRRTVLLCNLAAFSGGFVTFAAFSALPQVLTAQPVAGAGLGLDLTLAALGVSTLGLTMSLTAPIAARLIGTIGPRATLAIGGVFALIGTLVPVFFLDELWQILVAGALMGVGLGTSTSAIPALLMPAVPVTETASANGLNQVLRTIGSTAGSTVTGVIVAASMVTVGDVSAPARWAYTVIFALAAVAAAIGLVAALLVARPQRAPATVS